MLYLIIFLLSIIVLKIESKSIFLALEKILTKILASLISFDSSTFVTLTKQLSIKMLSFEKILLTIFWIWISMRVDLLNGLIELILMTISF